MLATAHVDATVAHRARPEAGEIRGSIWFPRRRAGQHSHQLKFRIFIFSSSRWNDFGQEGRGEALPAKILTWNELGIEYKNWWFTHCSVLILKHAKQNQNFLSLIFFSYSHVLFHYLFCHARAMECVSNFTDWLQRSPSYIGCDIFNRKGFPQCLPFSPVHKQLL